MEVLKEVNPHFEDFLFDWDYKFYFLVGGYGSSKSYHIALKIILKLLQEKRTCLVVRDVYDTIRDSCFSLFTEICTDMNLERQVRFTNSPMQMRFLNGSKILFRGLDKPGKLKSINNISLVWIEECSEIKYAGFKELLGRLRHPTLRLHMLLSTNPVSRSNWTYKHFFKAQGLDDHELYKKRVIKRGNIYYHHSVADDNLFLPAEYIDQLDDLENYDTDLYRVARLGQFGVNGLLVLPQFEVQPHEQVMQAVERIPRKYKRVGMDFGFESSYNAVLRMAIDHENKWLYIYWEYYRNHMTDDETADALSEFVETRERIKADSAEPKAIRYYQKRGFNMVATHKSNGGTRHSRLDNTRKMKRFRRIICSDHCRHCIDELKELTYAVDRDNEIIPDEFNIDPHTFSAMWYGLDDYDVADLKYKVRKEDFGL
ncbi:PBSX family phage terminase large subunit [Mitsuokella jalaludinii]|uniref:PBSX family phage terminase large subunit n=1 Tax=Mitsuokella jalaludinii TaxID=187979 RepID=UPI001D005B1D|nr:PBSX family phage terminase large subunit [Mitsuokella jalaludinii]MCB5724441.1 PBSX family phage terminase large subunit [Mitsuokella jalaludinii]